MKAEERLQDHLDRPLHRHLHQNHRLQPPITLAEYLQQLQNTQLQLELRANSTTEPDVVIVRTVVSYLSSYKNTYKKWADPGRMNGGPALYTDQV